LRTPLPKQARTLANLDSNRLHMDRLLSARQIRSLLGWSRRELAIVAGISQGTIKAIEQGKTDARLSTLRKLARTFTAHGSLWRDHEVVSRSRMPRRTSGLAGRSQPVQQPAALRMLRKRYQPMMLRKGTCGCALSELCAREKFDGVVFATWLPVFGTGGREFKSPRSDQSFQGLVLGTGT
jgi:transcriptional regulator with XRE-family HTH domain